MESIEDREEKLLQKHRKERKELQAKIQALKKTSTKGDKKKKKEVAEEIAQLELQLEKQQNEELEELRQVGPSQGTENKEEVAEEVASTPEPSTTRVSKAQRRRDKKAIKEKEREQMIIEAEAENVHGARNVETQKIKQMLKERKLMLQEVPSDGNCLYCAVDDQLKSLGNNALGIDKLRKMTSQYLLDHKSDFLPFLSHPDTGDILTDTQYEEYCNEAANTAAWGGEVELRALSHVLKCCIEVIQATGPSVMVGEEYQDLRQAVLTFHRHMYGLGEHYNSVKPYVEEEEEDTEKTV